VVGLQQQRRRGRWTSYATFEAIAKAKGIQAPQIWEGKKGGAQTAVRELNLEVRPLLDELIVEKTIDFITRQAGADKPFFTYVGLSHVHPPEAVHADFDQTDPARLGQYADLIAEMDYRVGQIVDCIDQAGSPTTPSSSSPATTRPATSQHSRADRTDLSAGRS